ncbi:MAG: HU family DNA-binding protein [Eubacteriales bacterium]|jgi:DNA-binding protein HU-beta|nr:HU family DNA-binding protein [Eubacteriales bacterium]MDD4716903.1 HU family DNA-binding protein [Eubacteriales bacterium]NCU26975.1 HU family DNA-binding protein [Candidatus Nomurabacteria bacterium]
MNKSELIDAVASKSELSKKDSEKAVNAVVEAVKAALAKGDKVQLVGFGTFEVRKRNARTGLNPQTKKAIKIPATKVPAFKAGKALKDAVAK